MSQTLIFNHQTVSRSLTFNFNWNLKLTRLSPAHLPQDIDMQTVFSVLHLSCWFGLTDKHSIQTLKSILKRDKTWKRTQSKIQPSWNKSSLLFQTRVELYVYFRGHSLWCCWTVLEVSPSSFSQSVQYNATQSEFGSRDLQLTHMLEMKQLLYNQI